MTSSAPAPQQPSAAPRRSDNTIRVSPTSLWILHREDAVRRGLAHRLGVRGALLGDPRDAGREGPAVPRAIVLGASGDFEAELEFAYRMAGRAPDLEWLVVARDEDLPEARRLFDTLPGHVVDLEGETGFLRGHIRALLSRRQAPPLSERRRRRALTERFTRWHADLGLPELLAATDPKRVRVPVWIRGEPGSGRGVLARYLHQLATGVPAGPFVVVECGAVRDLGELRSAWAVECGALPSGLLTTVCFESVDALTPALQCELARWIEYGAPPGFVPSARIRWMATSSDELQTELRNALAGLEVVLPALRDDRERIEQRAHEAAAAWCRAQELPERALSPEAIERLQTHNWPGNLRELEAVLARSLAVSSGQTLPAAALLIEASDVDDAFARGDSEPFESPAFEAGEDPRDVELPETESPDERNGVSFEETGDDPVFLASELAEETSEPEELVLTAEIVAEDTPDSLLDAPEMTDAFGTARETAATGPSRHAIRRLAGAIAHEIGNPMVGIRSFAQMLPRRFEDPEFRRVASERVAADAARIEAALETLTRIGESSGEADGLHESVDLSALIGGLLAERRSEIQRRGLVVLEELDREDAHVQTRRDRLHTALVSLLDAVFHLLPDRGDLYVATQGRAENGSREPFVRAVVRFASSDAAVAEGLSRVEQSLGIAAATLLIDTMGGQLVVDQSEAPTTLILFELPAAPEPLSSL